MKKYSIYTLLVIIIILLITHFSYCIPIEKYNGCIPEYKTYLSDILLNKNYLSQNSHKYNCDENEDMILNKETALIVGSAILREHYPEWHKMREGYYMEAIEENGIWNVYSLPPKKENYSIKGGGIYVKFYKNNGQVIDIGITE